MYFRFLLTVNVPDKSFFVFVQIKHALKMMSLPTQRISVPTSCLRFTGQGNLLGKTLPLSSVCTAFLGFLLDTESAWNANLLIGDHSQGLGSLLLRSSVPC